MKTPLVATFMVGDVFDRLAKIEDGSIDLVVTSPPFLALRSYLPVGHPDKGKEVGTEPTPTAFLDTLLDLTAEFRRVLAPHGSIAVELGDTYSGSGGAGGDYTTLGLRADQPRFRQARSGRDEEWALPKSLCFIPSLYGASLAYGRNLLNPGHAVDRWRVRNLIAWTRPNPPVGELGDKVRPATSYVTVACVERRRYFDLDAERTEAKEPERDREFRYGTEKDHHDGIAGPRQTFRSTNPAGAPLLDHWMIPTTPYRGAHYAVFPAEIPRRLVSLMCPPKVCLECGQPSERITKKLNATGRGHRRSDAPDRGSRGTTTEAPDFADRVTVGWSDCGHGAWRRGVVLDPFVGSGTTLAVATTMGRDAVGIDLDRRNVDLALERVGIFLEVDE